jgi:homogentisate phytyltransferase / homogentisate geranylgeranyltransferase
MLQALKTRWDFTRPHTIIGSFLSITTLFILASTPGERLVHLPLYGWTLLSALACNVFITGLNQITDVEMDKINKPFLPLASGAMSLQQARNIVGTNLVVCLVAAWVAAPVILVIMSIILLIGTAYSAPPLRLKRHHIPAALCIIVVRGVLVNLAIGAAFDWQLYGRIVHWQEWTVLMIFVSVFSLAIAWFKDLYDTQGDDLYQIRTFPLLYSVQSTYKWGNSLVVLAYVAAIGLSWSISGTTKWILVAGHALLMLLFIGHALRSSVGTREGMYRFYMVFWVFFFAEYALFLGYGGAGK